MVDELRTETKQMLRSLVMSHPKGLSIYHVCRDYREMEGRDPPFRQLGFNTMSSMLRLFKDTVRFGINKEGQEVLYSVATEDTAHIADLSNEEGRGGSKTKLQPLRTYSFVPSRGGIHPYTPQSTPMLSDGPNMFRSTGVFTNMSGRSQSSVATNYTLTHNDCTRGNVQQFVNTTGTCSGPMPRPTMTFSYADVPVRRIPPGLNMSFPIQKHPLLQNKPQRHASSGHQWLPYLHASSRRPCMTHPLLRNAYWM